MHQQTVHEGEHEEQKQEEKLKKIRIEEAARGPINKNVCVWGGVG